MSKGRLFRRDAIGPILLLTLSTSLAFNNALLSSERREEERLWAVQHSVLADILTQHTVSRETSQRLRNVGLDPTRFGLPPPTPTDTHDHRPKDITWSQIFFGKSNLVHSLRKTAAGIRESFAGGLKNPRAHPQDTEALEHEWREELRKAGFVLDDKGQEETAAS